MLRYQKDNQDIKAKRAIKEFTLANLMLKEFDKIYKDPFKAELFYSMRKSMIDILVSMKYKVPQLYLKSLKIKPNIFQTTEQLHNIRSKLKKQKYQRTKNNLLSGRNYSFKQEILKNNKENKIPNIKYQNMNNSKPIRSLRISNLNLRNERRNLKRSISQLRDKHRSMIKSNI